MSRPINWHEAGICDCFLFDRPFSIDTNKDITYGIIHFLLYYDCYMEMPSLMAMQNIMSFSNDSIQIRTLFTMQTSTVFPLGEKGPRSSPITSTPPVKLLTRLEQLKLLSKAEKAGLLSAAESFGFSLSTIERLGLLSKAEELGVLSAATDPGTPGSLLTLSLLLLLLGPLCVYVVPEDNLGEVGVQIVVALISVVGGSAAFAASNFVSNLQKLR